MFAVFATNETEARRMCVEWAGKIRRDWTVYPTQEMRRGEGFGPLRAKSWAAPAVRAEVPDCEVRILIIEAAGEFARWPYDTYQGRSSALFMAMFPA